MRIITYIILSCFIAACSQSRSGGELEQALKLSGENRNALEAVLGHYKHDSLKYGHPASLSRICLIIIRRKTIIYRRKGKNTGLIYASSRTRKNWECIATH